MKRKGYLHEKVYDIDNIEYADLKARKNKIGRWGIDKHDENKDQENLLLSQQLENLIYQTSEYSTFTIYEPKEREIFRLPYYPDRIAHHAIMNITEPVWTKIFINQTYSCIKNRGIHNVVMDVKKVLTKYPKETTYCLKMDVRKFYPSVNHDILFDLIQRKIKDPNLLKTLKEIIDSSSGVPIGNYLSQFFANLYLAYFDHWAKEELKCKFYFRYADDIVILSDNKDQLRSILVAIKVYLKEVLQLELKPNYQIFPVENRGIDFVGYKFYHSHVLLRKSIKMRMFRLIHKWEKGEIAKEELEKRLQSYFGWLKFCNAKHLLTKIYERTGIKYSNWQGKQINISRVYNKSIHIVDIAGYKTYFRVNFIYKNKPYYFESKNKRLLYDLLQHELPINFKIKAYAKRKKNQNRC